MVMLYTWIPWVKPGVWVHRGLSDARMDPEPDPQFSPGCWVHGSKSGDWVLKRFCWNLHLLVTVTRNQGLLRNSETQWYPSISLALVDRYTRTGLTPGATLVLEKAWNCRSLWLNLGTKYCRCCFGSWKYGGLHRTWILNVSHGGWSVGTLQALVSPGIGLGFSLTRILSYSLSQDPFTATSLWVDMPKSMPRSVDLVPNFRDVYPALR